MLSMDSSSVTNRWKLTVLAFVVVASTARAEPAAAEANETSTFERPAYKLLRQGENWQALAGKDLRDAAPGQDARDDVGHAGALRHRQRRAVVGQPASPRPPAERFVDAKKKIAVGFRRHATPRSR